MLFGFTEKRWMSAVGGVRGICFVSSAGFEAVGIPAAFKQARTACPDEVGQVGTR
jgi:hypothetical protein